MKKICYIATVSSALTSFVLASAKYIINNTDWQITFVCSEDKAFKELLPEQIKYFPIDIKRGIHFGGIKATYSLYKFFKTEKFDLVQYCTPNASFYSSIAAKMARIPIRLYCQWGIIYVGFSGIKRFIFKLLEKVTCKFSTHIEPDSYGNLDFSRKEKIYNKKKGSVIWNGSACGVDLGKFNIEEKRAFNDEIRSKYNISNNIFVFGFIGRITRDKGINELLSAFKHLTEKYDNIQLMLVGNIEKPEQLDSELYQWAQDVGTVVFTGRVNTPEKYFSALNCFCLPSYREGFGTVVIEAEAMSVPVIVTDIVGPTEAMIDDYTGIKVECKNAEALKDAMEKILLNQKNIDYGKNGLNFVKEKFDQKVFMQYMLADRKELLNEN